MISESRENNLFTEECFLIIIIEDIYLSKDSIVNLMQMFYLFDGESWSLL